MKRKLLSLLFAAALCIGIFSYIPTTVQADNVTDDQIVEALHVVYRNKEGNYDSIYRNDNGALSIGILQWHGIRALRLMKRIVAADPETAYALLGESLYREIVETPEAVWDTRIVSLAEADKLSALLATDLSCRIQLEVGREDMMKYISHGRSVGVQTPEALVYYCDLENQYGAGGAGNLVKKIKAKLGKQTVDTLDEFHFTLLQVTGNYHSRRTWTYEYCRSLNWSNIVPGSSTSYSSGYRGSSYSLLPSSTNLDLQSPEVQRAQIICLNHGAFRVEIEATDNERIEDCRIEVGSDVLTDQEWAAYATQTGNVWTYEVLTGSFSVTAKEYFVNLTVSDPSGNGTSRRLKVSKEALFAGQVGSCSAVTGHQFMFQYDTKATCNTAGFRVEQCSTCYKIRRTLIEPTKRHRFLFLMMPPTCTEAGYLRCSCELCGISTDSPTKPPNGHQWAVMEIATEQRRVCSVCGAFEE